MKFLHLSRSDISLVLKKPHLNEGNSLAIVQKKLDISQRIVFVTQKMYIESRSMSKVIAQMFHLPNDPTNNL